MLERKHNAEIVLRILLAGGSISFDESNTEYCYQDGVFGVSGKNISTGEKIVLPADLSLEDFIKLSEKIPFEKLFLKSSEIVLTEMNQKDRR